MALGRIFLSNKKKYENYIFYKTCSQQHLEPTAIRKAIDIHKEHFRNT